MGQTSGGALVRKFERALVLAIERAFKPSFSLQQHEEGELCHREVAQSRQRIPEIKREETESVNRGSHFVAE